VGKGESRGEQSKKKYSKGECRGKGEEREIDKGGARRGGQGVVGVVGIGKG